MPDIVTVRFKTYNKVYDFDSQGLGLHRGELVVVESELGLSLGTVICERHQPEPPKRPLKPVIRKASEEDMAKEEGNASLKEEARLFCIEKITARGLPMKLISTDVTLDRRRIIFYFVANTRIDFRELVKDLAAKFKSRIELRQIGVRDEARIVGGFGVCGMELCCRQFLTSFEPISIRMAKQQELVLNTSKLSGACGRLMCCLGYECVEGAASPGKKGAVTPGGKEAAPSNEKGSATPGDKGAVPSNDNGSATPGKDGADTLKKGL